MRSDEENNLVMVDGMFLRAEEVLHERHFTESWSSAYVPVVLILKKTSNEIALAFLQPNHLINGLLTDDWLRHSADGCFSRFRTDFDFDFQGHVTVVVNGGLHLHVDADIDVGKLRLPGCRRRRSWSRIRTGGNRNFRANLKGSLLTICGAEPWILHDSRLAVRQQETGCGGADGHLKVLGIEMRQIIQIEFGIGVGTRTLQSRSERLWELNSQIAHLVLAECQHCDIDHYLRACSVEVVDQFLCNEELVRTASHHNRVLARDEEYFYAWVHDIAQRGHEFVRIVLLCGVGKIKRLECRALQAGSLHPRVSGYEDRIGGIWLRKCSLNCHSDLDSGR